MTAFSPRPVARILTGVEVDARLSRIPFMQDFELSCEVCADGHAVVTLPYKDYLRTSCGRFLDAAALAAVMDQLGSIAIWGRYSLWYPHATLSLNVAFLEPPRPGTVRFEGRIVADAEGVCCISLTAMSASTRTPVAFGTSSFVMGAYASGTAREKSQLAIGAIESDASCFAEHVGYMLNGGQCSLPFQRRLIGSPDPESLHGGAIAAGVIAAASMLVPESRGQTLKGLSLEYLKGGQTVDTAFTARAVGLGRRSSTFVVDGNQEGGRHIASALVRFANFSELHT